MMVATDPNMSSW